MVSLSKDNNQSSTDSSAHSGAKGKRPRRVKLFFFIPDENNGDGTGRAVKSKKQPKPYTPLFGMDSPGSSMNAFTGEALKQAEMQKRSEEAEDTVRHYAKTANALVGYDNIINQVLASVMYHIVKNQNFKKFKNSESGAPPQVFVLKGSSGTGKTALANSMMYEAWKMGKEVGVPVYSMTAEVSDFTDMHWGETEKKTRAIFDKAFERPTVLFIDEFQGIANRGTGINADSLPAAALALENTIIQKMNDAVQRERQCIIILATDRFGSLPQPIKRRAVGGIFDLDVPGLLKRTDSVALTQRELERCNIRNLKPEEVYETIEKKYRSMGHARITPADIINEIRMVADSSSNELLSKEELIRIANGQPSARRTQREPTLDDFKRHRNLKEYAEEARSGAIANMVQMTKPDITLDDVGGMAEKKEEVFKDVKLALKPEEENGSRASRIHGILLNGPPGTGKTWLTKAIAGEMNATVYIVNGAEILRPYHGQSVKIITDLFAEARKNAPSIIIFDEIESITTNRSSVHGSSALEVINALLAEMGGLKQNNGVVVVGTTNRIDLVDPAFLRPGRFDRKIEINLPKTDAERLEIISVHLNKHKKFVDSSVTAEKILELSGKRTFSPAMVERAISDGVQLWEREIEAAGEVTSIPKDDTIKLNRIMRIYGKDLKRLYLRLGIPVRDGVQTEMTPEIYKALNEVKQDNYKINIEHFVAAIAEIKKNEQLDKARKFTKAARGERPEPTVGKVYGLTIMTDAEGSANSGLVAPLECVGHIAKEGGAELIGSEADNSIKDSAKHAREFLNNESDGALSNYAMKLEFITPAKGLDQKAVQGPSAGLAMALVQYSNLTDTPALPNVVMTGGITIKGEVLPVGGLDHKGMGKLNAAVEEEGVDTIIIPRGNFERLTADDIKYFNDAGLKVVPASNFWEAAAVALVGNPDEKSAREKLKNIQKLKVLKRSE